MIETKTINNKVLQSFVEKDIGGFMQGCKLENSSFCPDNRCHECPHSESDQLAIANFLMDHQGYGGYANMIKSEKKQRSLFMTNGSELIEVTHEDGNIFIDRSQR